MRLVTWEGGGPGTWNDTVRAVRDLRPDVVFARGPAGPPEGEATDLGDPGRDIVLHEFPAGHPLAEFSLLHRRVEGGASTPAILWRTDLTADPGRAVTRHGPAEELCPRAVGFGLGRGGPTFVVLAAGASPGRSSGPVAVLERLDDLAGGPWVAAGFDAAPAGLRAGLRDRSWSLYSPGAGSGTECTPADSPDHYFVRSDGTGATGEPLPAGPGGPAERGVVYDVRAPEPAGVRSRAPGGWQAAHSPPAGVAMWPPGEPSESASD